MPKELFSQTPNDPFLLELRWGNGPNVQIATVMAEPLTDTAPQNLAQLVKTWEPSTQDMGRGLYKDLDREEINRLIRSLRRARDNVFGQDA